MSVFPGVPVDAAYHVVSGLAGLLAPLAGGLATAAAIAGFTVAIRLLLLPLSYRAMRGTAAQGAGGAPGGGRPAGAGRAATRGGAPGGRGFASVMGRLGIVFIRA